MKFAILPCSRACIGLTISICLMLGFLAAYPAAAQSDGDGYTKITLPLGDAENTYAEMATILPSAVSSEAYDHKILDYMGGRDINTNILLNGSIVTIHLLYPCEPPRALLGAEDLMPVLATAYDIIKQANYTETNLSISGRPTVVGELGSSIFAAYQPTNQTAALIVMANNLDPNIIENLLYNMNIIVDESMTPIPSEYCSDVTAASNESVTPNEAVVSPDETAAISADATESATAAVDDAAGESAAPTTDTIEDANPAPAPIQNGPDSAEARKDKAEKDREAAMAKLEEARANMRGR